jgi:hypothetical protein
MIIMSNEKREEFKEAAKPLMKFLNENCHPHIIVIVDCDSAELLEGVCLVKGGQYEG